MANHPSISPFIRDDTIIGDVDFSRLDTNQNFFFKLIADGKEAGFAFLYLNQGTPELHSGLLPTFRGSTAIKFGKMVVDWVIKNTNFSKLTTYSWDVAKNVILVTKCVGFIETNRELWPNKVNGKDVYRVNYFIDLNNLRTI